MFKARGLLYAERLRQRDPDAPMGRWNRAYAFALAGMHAEALEDLKAAIDLLPGRQICVARELTKKFEEFRRGSAAELLGHYEAHPPKGEIVLLIANR